MSSPYYASVIVRGSGFQPNELLNLDVASGPEGGKQQLSAKVDGTFFALIFPAVKGQLSGTSSVAITCPLKVRRYSSQICLEGRIPYPRGWSGVSK